jgi:hypothetical protein
METTGYSDGVTKRERRTRKGWVGGLKRNSRVVWLAAVLTTLVLLGTVQWRSGAWNASYGAYPDEPSHFMGGLMVRDFLVSGSLRPIDFAEKHYLFQPYFAIGYWPPLFYIVEGVWMLVAGYSRGAMMVLTGIIAAGVALLLFATARRWAPVGLSLAVAAAFLAIPSVQWSSSVVMTDLAVTLLCLVTTLALGSYLETRTWRWAIVAGVTAGMAILTKYLAVFLFLPPLILILIDRRWNILRSGRTWALAAIVAVLCGPWVFWWRRFALIGFDLQQLDHWSRSVAAFRTLHGDLGSVFSAIAIMASLWAMLHWSRLDVTQRLLLLQLPCLIVFLVIGPSDIEARYLICGYPAILIVTATVIQWLTGKQKGLYRFAIAALCVLVVVELGTSKPNFPGGVTRQIAKDLIAKGPSVILVPTHMEGPMIAELASAVPVRSTVMMIRPTKLLARLNWLGTQYESLLSDEESMAALFEKYPIDTIILAKRRGLPEYPHEVLLSAMLKSDRRWVLERRYTESAVDWAVYRKSVPAGTPREPLIAFVRGHLRSVR